MVRISLSFIFIALLALIAADISISTLDPWGELGKIGVGLLTPDLLSLSDFGSAILNTISFALLGISIAVVLGSLLSLVYELMIVRLFCSFIRSIHELFWAFIFMPLVGLNSLCGILAIAIPYSGIFAKVYAEIRQESDRQPYEALPPDSSRLSGFLFATLPVIYRDLKNYTSYRFECALRSSAILGFIGLPTLGYHLETAFREGLYSQATALLYSFYLLIASIHLWAKSRVILVLIVAACWYTSWDMSFSSGNIIRFFTYDILPWPMKADGYYAGTLAITFPVAETFQWAVHVLKTEVLPGAWNTLVLTQIALVCTGLFALLSFPFASTAFYKRRTTWFMHTLLIVCRTTPEYIIAYIFLTLWGPSMLPAIVALFLHNGAILSYLTARNGYQMEIPFDGPISRLDRFCYEVLPRCYGQFLAFLFYRWEIIMRESAILGILGVTTLGYYVDNAISNDHLDVAALIIVVTALLTMAIDRISNSLRKRYKISGVRFEQAR
ncbi:PhnE/PtxC family ABC transporter permease [Desulfosediminicola sp.]|uniref:PhnE/PtxC family ABC transporter permease n=1 Tax=Desulfosediminicola sp. TaxID=2886825 RepID=UPI003AF25AD3